MTWRVLTEERRGGGGGGGGGGGRSISVTLLWHLDSIITMLSSLVHSLSPFLSSNPYKYGFPEMFSWEVEISDVIIGWSWSYLVDRGSHFWKRRVRRVVWGEDQRDGADARESRRERQSRKLIQSVIVKVVLSVSVQLVLWKSNSSFFLQP